MKKKTNLAIAKPKPEYIHYEIDEDIREDYERLSGRILEVANKVSDLADDVIGWEFMVDEDIKEEFAEYFLELHDTLRAKRLKVRNILANNGILTCEEA